MGMPGGSQAKEDRHSWGRLQGGPVVDGTLNICPKGASVAAGVQVCSGWGRKCREGWLSRRSCRGLARAGPVVSTQGALGPGLTEWWEALVEAKGERALAPVLSVELATLVSKNNKIGSWLFGAIVVLQWSRVDSQVKTPWSSEQINDHNSKTIRTKKNGRVHIFEPRNGHFEGTLHYIRDSPRFLVTEATWVDLNYFSIRKLVLNITFQRHIYCVEQNISLSTLTDRWDRVRSSESKQSRSLQPFPDSSLFFKSPCWTVYYTLHLNVRWEDILLPEIFISIAQENVRFLGSNKAEIFAGQYSQGQILSSYNL